MTKQHFALYLEELAAELRAFKMNREYLEEMHDSLMHNFNSFYDDAKEYCRLREIEKG
ncbi:hypothetical protein UFOVP100_35 [uncultured Caudovirales phage]|uniref:Uncharacterized protein n=1 Tax=uncultured Caudovirales phage TaxID=2100421 RepID=A0A6J5L280_9CAUD|nr:hypothetical protein UFOVP100_35 [uncultured Caudovirales phage]